MLSLIRNCRVNERLGCVISVVTYLSSHTLVDVGLRVVEDRPDDAEVAGAGGHGEGSRAIHCSPLAHVNIWLRKEEPDDVGVLLCKWRERLCLTCLGVG